MIRFCYEAVNDIEEAIDWYLPRSLDAAEKFNRAIFNVLREIESDPTRYAKIHLDYQYARVVGFPYICIFRQNADHIQILAIAHTSRKERYWIDRE
jgi:plasmid stabilization system protein ParE